jgi:hypothetical protein
MAFLAFGLARTRVVLLARLMGYSQVAFVHVSGLCEVVLSLQLAKIILKSTGIRIFIFYYIIVDVVLFVI